jgi:hypothetical protein
MLYEERIRLASYKLKSTKRPTKSTKLMNIRIGQVGASIFFTRRTSFVGEIY